MIIPDKVRPDYFANLISGLAMNMVGPYTLKLFFQGFVVLVGVLILSGAVNTAIVGASGVVNRISEDGVLTPWFRKPHRRFGTTYRVINLITLLQIFTIIASRGNVYLLASLYAFGVIWSFSFMSLAVLVLRFIDHEKREFKVPGNLRVGKIELPIGLGLISLLLFATAFTNLFTKQARDDLRHFLQRLSLRRVHDHGTASPIRKPPARVTSWNSFAFRRRTNWTPRSCRCAPATYWSPSAIPRTSTTCAISCGRPTPQRLMSW